MGLGKEMVGKELEKEFVHRKFVVAHVLPTNTASLWLCQSQGARRVFDVAWVTILMNRYRDNQMPDCVVLFLTHTALLLP
jgi:hypothetical protein